MQKGHDLISKKQTIKIIVVCIVMGLLLMAYDYKCTIGSFDGNIKRSAAGQGNKIENFQIDFLDQEKDIDITVSEQSLSAEEVQANFAKAIEEIDETYLGKNQSADNVSYDLNLQPSYCNGLITAYWKFDEYGLVGSDGTIREDKIPKEGKVVNIISELTYEGESQLYSFTVVLCPKSLNTTEGQIAAIENAVEQADMETRNNEVLTLPKEVENIPIIWKRKMNYRGLQVILLGIVTAFGIQIGKKRDERLQAQALIEEKEQDYPMIVSELSILMSAGMSFRKALERIVSRYNAKKQSGNIRAGYEDISYTYRQICDGNGEIAALEKLGSNSESKEYRKLAMLLVQNLRKGSRDLIDCLEKEEKYAFEMRKQKAIRAGEEASTKLLIPMAGMLFIVIIILVVPAIMQMNI